MEGGIRSERHLKEDGSGTGLAERPAGSYDIPLHEANCGQFDLVVSHSVLTGTGEEQ
jgi:hypothetical protein